MNRIAWPKMRCPFDRESMKELRGPSAKVFSCPECAFEVPYQVCGEDPFRVVEPGRVACGRHWGHAGMHETPCGILWEEGADWYRFDLEEANSVFYDLVEALQLKLGCRVWMDGVPLHGPRFGDPGYETFDAMRIRAYRLLHALGAAAEADFLRQEVCGSEEEGLAAAAGSL